MKFIHLIYLFLFILISGCSKPKLMEEYTEYSSGESKTSTYAYQDNGEIDSILVEPSYSSWTLYDYEYDEEGNNTVIQREYSGGYLGKKEFEYDSKDRVIEVYWDSLTNEYYIITYEYDQNDEVIGEYHLYSDDHWISHEYINLYDENFNLIQQTDIMTSIQVGAEETNTRTNIMEFEYNEDGELLKETETISGKFVTTTYYQYDNKQNLILETQTNTMGVWETVTYDYNTRGKLAEKLLETSAGSWNKTTYRYE